MPRFSWIILTHLFFLFPTLSLNAQIRMIPHVTGAGGGFETTIFLENTDDEVRSVTLSAFDQSGNAVANATETIQAETTESFSVSELFGSAAGVSHFSIQSSGVNVSAAYRASAGPGSAAHLSEANVQSMRWRLYPGDWSVVFDGIAVVNTGNSNSDIWVSQYDFDDQRIQRERIAQSLAPNAKALYVIGAPQGSAFSAISDSYFEVTGSQDLAITALRGSPPGAAIGYLWENAVRPLAERPSEEDLTKWEKWLTPSYFRGFDVGYWCEESDCSQTLENFQALKNSGANIAQIQNTEGMVFPNPPYGPDPSGTQGLDEMVGFCRQVGLDYVIAVRVGPGRQDVAFEGEDGVPMSSIWTDTNEQALYAQMLVDIVTRYESWNDPHFVGLNVIVEPSPLWGFYETPSELLEVSQQHGVDINALNTRLINAVRTADANLPIIVQSKGLSNPEYWGLLEKQADPYIIYDHHCYVPFDYTHHDAQNGVTYPGRYWNDTVEDEVLYDKEFMRDVVLAKVRQFQNTHNVPIFMGEFGMLLPQNGGVEYLTDLYEIATEYGWHFSLWTYRSDNAPDFIDFNYEKWDTAYWTMVLSFFHIP